MYMRTSRPLPPRLCVSKSPTNNHYYMCILGLHIIAIARRTHIPLLCLSCPWFVDLRIAHRIVDDVHSCVSFVDLASMLEDAR